MVVPVAMGGNVFDYRELRAEQSRLSKFLLNPSPREIDDTSQNFEVLDDQTPAGKYQTYAKLFFQKDGDKPIFKLYMKDNLDQEFLLSPANYATQTPPAAGNTVPINGATANAPADFLIDSVTGDIFQTDGTLTLNADGTVNNPGAIAAVGKIKFDAGNGLDMATINERIANVSNAVEGMTKILSVVSQNLDASINLIR